MRKLLSLFLLIAVCISCKKSSPEASALDGTWTMEKAEYKANGTVLTRSAALGNVVITFKSSNDTSGIFYGKTPSNDIWQNPYTTGSSQSLSIKQLGMTKVGENAWGIAFVDHITKAFQYRLPNSKILEIETAANVLTFSKN